MYGWCASKVKYSREVGYVKYGYNRDEWARKKEIMKSKRGYVKCRPRWEYRGQGLWS